MNVVEVMSPVNGLGITVKFVSLPAYCSMQPYQVCVVEAVHGKQKKQIEVNSIVYIHILFCSISKYKICRTNM